MNGKDFSNFGVIGRIVEDLDFQNLYFYLFTSSFFLFSFFDKKDCKFY